MSTGLNSKPVVWYSAGTIIRQLSAFIMLPIYTQYLSPAEYGIVGLLAMILGLYEIFLGARFGSALPKFYYDKDSVESQKKLISTALIFTAFISFFGGVIFAISGQPLSEHFFEREDLVYAISAYGVLLFTSSIEEYALVFLRLRDKPFYFFVVSMLKLSLQLSLNIYFVVNLKMGVEGVIFGGIIASICLALITGTYTLRYTGFRFDASLAKSLWSFTWPMWIAGLGAIYINFVTNLLIKYFASLEEIGIYHFALKFSSLIAMLVWKPFNQWWQSERFKIAKHSENPKKEFSSAFSLISFVLMFSSLGISLFSGTVIEIMADDAYASAKQIIPILCFMVLYGQLTFFCQFSLLKSAKTSFFPKIKFIKAILISVTVAVGAYYYSLQGAIYAIAACQIVEFLMFQMIGKKFYDQGLKMSQFYVMSLATYLYSLAVLSAVDQFSSTWVRAGWFVVACIVYAILTLTYLFLISSKGKEILEFIRVRMV